MLDEEYTLRNNFAVKILEKLSDSSKFN